MNHWNSVFMVNPPENLLSVEVASDAGAVGLGKTCCGFSRNETTSTEKSA